VTGRAVFGDFLDAARSHLATADRLRTVSGDVDIQEVSRSLLRLVVLIRQYVEDVTAGWGPERPRGRRRVLTGWTRAGVETREAIGNAAAFLNEPTARRRRPRAARSDLAWHLDAASASLTAGRDLLQTHLAIDPRGERQLPSEWGLVVTSPPVARAVLSEMRSLARRIAPIGAGIALAPHSRGTPEARQKLNAACQWLWVLNASVNAAQRQQPQSTSDLELLRAIPASAPPPRRLPIGAESVAGLCHGVISSAERVRHLAWQSIRQPAWSPGLSVNSLRRIAATSTLTSHHCEILLHSLAARPGGYGPADHATWLLQAAEAAGRTRQGWLHIAHALDRVTTDTRLYLSPDADESGDLALWTGRLAYADPEWTLASGPAHQRRPPETLVPRPGEIRLVVTAIHHACDTLASLGYAQREQIRAAGAAQRILVTTRSLPDTMDVPRPFAPALPDRIDSMVSACDQTGRSTEEATAQVAAVAAAIGAPSRVLTAAREAAGPGRRSEPGLGSGAARALEATEGGRFADERPELPGPVERTLYDLGVTNPDLLQRGADIDRAGERLIIDAADSLGPRRSRPSATTLSRSAGTAAMVNHALASSDPRAAALLHGPASAQREPPEAEP
jgi:hypothetical protein